MKYTQKEKDVVRSLATQYMQIATLPIQKEKVKLIKAFNSLEKVRPIVTIFQLPWNELNFDNGLNLVCENPFLRYIENFFRTQIFKWKNFPADMVIEPFFTIPFAVENSAYGIGIKEKTLSTDEENDIVSHSFTNQLVEDEDIEKIKEVKITLDKKESKIMKDVAVELIGDIIPIYQSGGGDLRFAFWDVLAELMGVQDIYIDILDRPEFIHSIMEKITNSALSGIKQINDLKIANTSANYCHCSPTYTNELLPDFMGGKEGTTYNSWACGMAQLFTSVSPQVTKEFEIPYISKIAKNFGMFYYGCCERLDDRLDIVQEIPNLRKISCSPWSDKKKFAEKLNPKLIMSNKPSPTFLATSTFDENAVEKDLRETCEIAKSNGLNVEFLLKDISTVRNDPSRLTKWAKITEKVVNDY